MAKKLGSIVFVIGSRANYGRLKAVIKKVGAKKIAGQEKLFVTFKLGPLNYIAYIELALQTGVIK